MRERTVRFFVGGDGGFALGEGVFQRRQRVGVCGMGVQIEFEVVGEEALLVDGAEILFTVHARASFPQKGI